MEVIAKIAIYPSGPTTVEKPVRKPYYINPTPAPGFSGDARFPLKVGTSDQIGAWQIFDLVKDGDDYYVESAAADRTLCFAPGGLETRPRGTRGSWERVRVQQEAQTNGNRFTIYRYHYDQLVACLDFVEVK